MDSMWMKVIWAVILLFFIVRMIPTAKDWLENGPRGSSKEWITTAALLGGVALFVFFLISLVRST